MSLWQASTKTPVSSTAELEEGFTVHGGGRRSKKAQAQQDAAIKAVTVVLRQTDEPVLVSASGAANEDGIPDQIHIHIAAVE